MHNLFYCNRFILRLKEIKNIRYMYTITCLYITHIFIWFSHYQKFDHAIGLKAQQDAFWFWSTMKKDVCLYNLLIITWEVENMVYTCRSRILWENVELHKLHAVINAILINFRPFFWSMYKQGPVLPTRKEFYHFKYI